MKYILFIKIGGIIGAFNTVSLIFCTAFIGIYYARYEGLNTLNQGLRKMVKNEMPIYELISGTLIAIGAIFLIIARFCNRHLLGFFNNFSTHKKINILKKFQ